MAVLEIIKAYCYLEKFACFNKTNRVCNKLKKKMFFGSHHLLTIAAMAMMPPFLKAKMENCSL